MLLVENSGAPLLLVPVMVAMPPLVPDTVIEPDAVVSVFAFRKTPWLLPLSGRVPERLMLPAPVVLQLLFWRLSAAAVPDWAPLAVAEMLPPLALMST